MRHVKKTLPSTRHSFLIGDVHIEIFDSRVSRGEIEEEFECCADV